MKAAVHRDQTTLAWTEKQFQQQVVGLARALGWWVYHPYDSRRSTPGYPDLTLVHPRHGIIWRELKTQKGPVSRHQREAIALIDQAGGDVAIWRPSDWADRTIHDTLDPRIVSGPAPTAPSTRSPESDPLEP